MSVGSLWRCHAAAAAGLLALIGLAACSEPHALLLTVRAEHRITSFDFFVRDQAAGEKLAETMGQDLGDQDISQPGQELRLAVRFSRAGDYLVHIVGHDGTGIQIATHVYEVDGTVEAHVVLVGLPPGADSDGDGFPSAEACTALAASGLDCSVADCNDSDPRVNPLGTEQCNGQDDDCDGRLPPDEADGDGDGFLACSPCDPGDETTWNAAYADCGDCDDAREDVHPASRRDPLTYPAAPEDCHNCGDGVDHNCDGRLTNCGDDKDCDGWVDCAVAGAPAPPLCDCDDDDELVHPGGSETCGDGRDNNCNEQIDEGCMPCDVDGDGFMRNDPANGCNPAPGEEDCDDTDSGIKPGAADDCDGKEGGCRGMGLRGYCGDTDLDGQHVIHDCNHRPGDWLQNSGCPDPTCDQDGDGFMRNDPASGCTPPPALTDCDDADPHTFPGAPDRCGDGKPQNCNLDAPCSNDQDGDGYNAGDDCDDGNPDVHPFAVELCNGIDDDCDGLTDEGNPDSSGGATVTGRTCTDSDLGVCATRPGACICSNQVPVGQRDPTTRTACPDENLGAAASPRCFGAGQPVMETASTCDGQDQNCNGLADDAPGEVPCAAGTACANQSGTWKCACGPGSCTGCCVHGDPDQCLDGKAVGQCGQAGMDCISCDDANPCTTDSCDGSCGNANLAEHSPCPSGQCRTPAGGTAMCCVGCWSGSACMANSDAGCGTGGVDCAAVNASCGLCRACDGMGTCGNVAVGQDPNDQCTDEGAGTCGRTGVCSGSGACQLYAAGTACATCKACNGLGSCGNVPAGQDPNNQCTDEGASSCGTDGSCNGSGACRLYASGTACGLCRQCDGSGSCGNVSAGRDPNNQCSDQGASSCGTDGSCDGSGACRLYASGARCATCKTCNGSGSCLNAGAGTDPNNDCPTDTQSSCGRTGVCDGAGACQLYASGIACATCKVCNGTGSCTNVPSGQDPNNQCSSEAPSTCGTTGDCNGSGACQYYPSGGVCGTCQACNGSGSCLPAAAGTDPNNQCSAEAQSTCGRTGDCNGSGSCQLYPSGTSCGTCRVCNGSGSCQNAAAGTDPNGDCPTDPASSCGRTGNCDGSGACQLYSSGTNCGTCKTCNGSGSCQNAAAGTDPNDQCSAEAPSTCGRTGDCNGSGACQLYPAGATCGTCHECNGSGSCGAVPDGTDPNSDCASNQTCCSGACAPKNSC